MIAHCNRCPLEILLMIVFLHRVPIGKDDERKIVNFTDSLYFDFISPSSQFSFEVNVVMDWGYDELSEIVFALFYIIHCELSN